MSSLIGWETQELVHQVSHRLGSAWNIWDQRLQIHGFDSLVQCLGPSIKEVLPLCKFLCQLTLVVVHQVLIHNNNQGFPQLQCLKYAPGTCNCNFVNLYVNQHGFAGVM